MILSLRQFSALVETVSFEAAVYTLIGFEIAAALSVPSVLLRRRGRPTSALAWLLALFALPAFGWLAWWAVGRTRIERKLRKHAGIKKSFVELRGAPRIQKATRFDFMLPARARGEYAFSSSGNDVTLLRDGSDAFPALRKELSSAEQCIHLLFYIFELDKTGESICEILIERARAGVKVRLLLDGLGCHRTARRLRAKLCPHGIEVAVFLPSRIWPLYAPRLNFVNHRKIVCIDNSVAFTGGMNIGRDYETHWRDLMLRIKGPSVESLNHIFLEDWFFATGEALEDPLRGSHTCSPTGCDTAIVSSGPDTESWIHDAYFMALTAAQSQITIATPYFIPTAPILTALRTAAGRGVSVRIVVPNVSDVKIVKWASRSFYPMLVDAGVRVFEYSGDMLHAKAMVVDDSVAAIGTANIDNRSFRLNFEVNCFIKSESISAELSDWMEGLFKDSQETTPEFLRNKGTVRKLLESVAHLFSPLL